jgi:hypothetical protein
MRFQLFKSDTVILLQFNLHCPPFPPIFKPNNIWAHIRANFMRLITPACVTTMNRKIVTLRLPLVVNAFWQIVHLKGLSPVWVRMCICSADEDEKFLLQTWHKCFGMPANTHTTLLHIKLLAFINVQLCYSIICLLQIPFRVWSVYLPNLQTGDGGK